MEDLKKNTEKDALKALEATFKLFAEISPAADNGGVCVWVTPSGGQFCSSALTQAQCAEITGSAWVPGGHC